MHYVKQFNINGVDTRQVACIESNGRPNAATEGCVGALCIDVTSPLHDVYKCVAVNGSIYTWELLSSGVSTISSSLITNGVSEVTFDYDTLRLPNGYIVKPGDLIIDKEGYLYQVSSISLDRCVATFCNTHLVLDKSAYAHAQAGGYTGTEEEFNKMLATEHVPTTRKVNGKELKGDITLKKADIPDFPTTETWTFTLIDGSNVSKAVYLG